jgi:hypothetical protein
LPKRWWYDPRPRPLPRRQASGLAALREVAARCVGCVRPAFPTRSVS